MASDASAPRNPPRLRLFSRAALLPSGRPTTADGEPAPTVGFLELFYDLVFVASTMVLSNAFSARPTWSWGLVCALMFVLVWLLWFHTTLLMNVERRDDFGHRALVLLQMFLISLTTLTFVDREATNNDYLGLAYGAAVLSVAALHHRVAASDIAAAPWARARRNRLLLAGVLLMANTALPDWADYAMFLAAILVLVVPTSVGAKLRRPPSVDVHHLTERAALLTLIMCGEAFVKVALVVSEGSIERRDLVAILVEFVVVFAFFWTYFDDVPQAGIRPGPFHGELWVLAHLPLQIGIVTIAIAMSKFLQVDHVHDEVVAILGVGWVLVFCGLALIGLQGQRVPRRPLLVLRLGTAALAAALALLDWYALWIWPELFVGLLTLLTVFHAVVARALRFQTTVVGAAATGAPH